MWLCGWIAAADDDEVDLAARVLRVLDDVAVGLHVEGVEELAPPLGGKMRLEIRNRTEAGTRRRALGPLRLGRDCHDGRLSSSIAAAQLAARALIAPVTPAIGRSNNEAPLASINRDT